MLGGSSSTEATQSNELPGYEPPFKERRLSRKLILRQDAAPKQNAIWTPTLRRNAQDPYISDEHDQDEENISPEQTASTEKSRIESTQYPIFTETILENTQFQSVLVDNINRILETSAERIDVREDSGSQETNPINNSLQEQVRHALDNIIMSTEQDPTFQQVLDDVVQHTAIYEQNVRASLSANDNIINTNGNDKTDSPVPLKQRLRNRSQDKPRPNYAEIDQSTKKKKKGKVEVISNEIVSGELRELLNPSTTLRTDSYVPLNQILYVNSDKSTSTFTGQDLVYVNLGSNVPSQFRIDADTPMYVQDISLANNGPSTSLIPGSIINLPTIEQQIQPIQSLLPNVIVKDIVEVSKTKQVDRSVKITPNLTKSTIPAKIGKLSSPRRQSHVRSLNFTNSDDSVNESEKDKSKLDECNKKLESAADSDVASTSQITRISELKNSDPKTSLEEMEPQQESSDAVDFSKEFDEATVISVQLSPAAATQSKPIKEDKPAEVSNEKKKPQTRRQCQKDLEMWKQMRQMKKGEWDNYLRQTVASGKTGKGSGERKRVKKRRSKIRPKLDDANVSQENEVNRTTDIQARLLEEALQSAKKPVSTVTESNTTAETEPVTNDTEKLDTCPSPPPVISTQKVEVKNSPSPSKRSSGGRKQLIQIKLPASAKKKPNVPVKRRSRSLTKYAVIVPPETQKPAEQTSRIDPSQTIDIDLISPIEHPKELNNPVKSGINLNSFLETPCKEASSFKYPITPGIVISSSIKTPGVRLNKDYDSLIKFPEYPTPSFAITPGRTKTPMSQTSSQKDGSSYNRATDYSSGSSYYKPDESDDIDRNLDALIKESVKETRNQVVESGLGVDPQQQIDSFNDQEASDGELSDSSSSSSSSSSASSTSTCSSSPSISDDNSTHAQASEDAKRLLIAQRTQQQLRLEQIRLRTMATLKSDNKIERFRKPKTKISTLQRQKVMDGSGIIKKPVQTLKMTGNSTPKVLPKVLPKHVNRPNPKTITTTPSKRKIATPRRVIYLDYKDTIKTGIRVVSNDRKSEQLQSQSNDNATVDTLKPLQSNNSVRSVTPTETIDAIENHIAKTSQQNSSVESPTKPAAEKPVDTPHLLHQLQDKSEVTDNATSPEAEGSSLKRAILVRELFGDGTMSDSDFMDTPVKAPASTIRSQLNVVAASEVPNEVTMKNSPSFAKKDVSSLTKFNDKRTITTNSDAAKPHVKDTNSNKSKDKDSDSKSIDPKATESKSKTNEPKTVDSKISEPSSDISNIKSSKSDSNEIESVESSEEHQIRDSPKAPVTDQETVRNILLVANDVTSAECKTDHPQAITTDSPSESEDGDDYDDCILISSSMISNGSNRTYHNVISDSKECAIKLKAESLDLRPMTTFLGESKIVIRTCEEVVLFNSSPVSSQASASKTVPKKRMSVKATEGVRKAEERSKKGQNVHTDGSDNQPTQEKNARFNIVAKHKGPTDTSSTHTSSR